MTLKQQIKQLNFDYANSEINDKRFPKQDIRGDFTLLHFEYGISSEDVIKEMDKQELLPANMWELLAYTKEGWNSKDWVVALGQSWVGPGDDATVGYIGVGEHGRELVLGDLVGEWDSRFSFLAVRAA